MPNCPDIKPPHPVLNGAHGEKLWLTFVKKESWGDVRLVCAFKSGWVNAEIPLLAEVDRLTDFASSMRELANGSCAESAFINADGNCEISCRYLANGSVEVAAHLIPSMVAEDMLHVCFVIDGYEAESFALQVTAQLEQESATPASAK